MEQFPKNQTEPSSHPQHLQITRTLGKIPQFCLSNGLLFTTLMWLLSRLLILVAMFLIAPSLPAPSRGIAPEMGWDVFAGWDGEWYHKLVMYGYEYADDGKQHTVAFFPLLALVIRGIMAFGLPFEVAGTLVNNLAFLAALMLIFVWVEQCHGKESARWTIATLAWCPFSLFGTVIYTEGLFLLLSSASLRAFEKQQYAWVALWGALASATRVTGVMLAPAFMIVAWRERRGVIAYGAGLATSVGALLYVAYCTLRFGDPLVFLHTQKAWGRTEEFAWQGWLEILRKVVIGSIDATTGAIKDPSHPVLFVGVCVIAFLLWRLRQAIGSIKVGYGFCLLGLVLWLLGGDSLIKAVMVFGGLYLLWQSRTQLSLTIWVYGLCVFALILNTGMVVSIDRYAYSIVSLAIAFGLWLARYPRWGYPIMGFFALLLVTFAIRFSQQLWVA